MSGVTFESFSSDWAQQVETLKKDGTAYTCPFHEAIEHASMAIAVLQGEVNGRIVNKQQNSDALITQDDIDKVLEFERKEQILSELCEIAGKIQAAFEKGLEILKSSSTESERANVLEDLKLSPIDIKKGLSERDSKYKELQERTEKVQNWLKEFRGVDLLSLREKIKSLKQEFLPSSWFSWLTSSPDPGSFIFQKDENIQVFFTQLATFLQLTVRARSSEEFADSLRSCSENFKILAHDISPKRHPSSHIVDAALLRLKNNES
ncbi:MAG: hypothetical protein K1000chlam3_00205 [Chlamydiae bacterium]|nr:hypothetical protein [Chlamydiota bacterium]